MARAREAASILILARAARGVYRGRERLAAGGGLSGRFRAATVALRERAAAAAPREAAGPSAPLTASERQLTPAEVDALRTDLSAELRRLAARERREPPARAA